MKNWTVREVIEVVQAGTSPAEVKEIARHFPMLFLAVAANDMALLAKGMPDKFTARTMERTFNAQATDVNEDADEDDVVGEDNGKDEGGVDLSAMSTKELMVLCDKRGIKVPHYGKNKQFYLDKLVADADEDEGEDEPVPAKTTGTGKGKGKSTKKVEAEDDGEEDAGDNYDTMDAVELFKLCKKRDIKVEPKKKANVYAALLRKADAAEVEDEGEDDDWGDDEEAPAKATGKGKKGDTAKANGKGKAKAEIADDDWDI